MEILLFLLSFFLKEYGGENFAPLLNGLKDGSFDPKSFIDNLSPENIAPIIKSFLNNGEKNPSDSFSDGLTPIASIADRDIVCSLNGYFAEIS